MIIVVESKTGFTKRYADMLGLKTGLKVLRTKEISKVSEEEIIFLGWMKVGKIQGLDKVRKHKVIAVCGSGTGRTAEPDVEPVIARNDINTIPFFYLRGGCLPLKEIKGMDRIMLSMFVNMLKRRTDKDERTEESITIIENGYDGVEEENLTPVLEWLNAR